MHAMVNPGIARGFGIEVDDIKCQKAHAFIKQASAELQRRGLATRDAPPPEVSCLPIEQVRGRRASLCWVGGGGG
jgi:hypothetical protein